MFCNMTLTASMQSNLHSLKSIAKQMASVQNILSTGKKVNSAIDNASSYYQASSLSSRARELNNLLDSMEQGIQTIETASVALESAISYLEQAAAAANQAITQDEDTSIIPLENETPQEVGIRSFGLRSANNYSVITAAMDTAEIQNLIVDGATLVLKEDITLTDELIITTSDVTIFGNGHSINFNSNDKAAITVKGNGASADINNIKINVNGTNAVGIKVIENASVTMDNLDGISTNGAGSQKVYYRNEIFFAGKDYTQASYNQLRTQGKLDGTAIDYVMDYSAGNEDTFAQKKWYMGAIGEWADLYGFNYENVGSGDNSAAVGDNFTIINQTLQKMGDSAETIKNGWYWSSSEGDGEYAWAFNTETGAMSHYTKFEPARLRCFLTVENAFDPKSESAPQVGDIMYDDRSWSSANDYEANVLNGKTAVGVVFDTDSISGDVKIVALKDAKSSIRMDTSFTDITESPNYHETLELKNTGNFTLKYYSAEAPDISDGEDVGGDGDVGGGEDVGGEDDATTNEDLNKPANKNYTNQLDLILNEYDQIINDASYLGVNLLKGADLTITFNETRSHKFTIKGKEISSASLGINTRSWQTKADVSKTMDELNSAVSSIRKFQATLGQNYSIIESRSNFTEALSNVLETGADNLILADMNEIGAQYLMLQTNQQLATNSLSLASQAAQSILSLF